MNSSPTWEGLTTLLSSTPASEILCILPTTSVFAPRLPDDIVAISRIAKRYDIPVIVNNAYGLQSRSICSSIDRAIRSGRIDLIVSSTDKNLLVPVGGAFVYGPRGDRIELIRKNYPGRASMSPILDVFITLLHFGKEGILELLSRREECVDYMREQLGSLAQKYGQRLLDVKHNPFHGQLHWIPPTPTIRPSSTRTRISHGLEPCFILVEFRARAVSVITLPRRWDRMSSPTTEAITIPILTHTLRQLQRLGSVGRMWIRLWSG